MPQVNWMNHSIVYYMPEHCMNSIIYRWLEFYTPKCNVSVTMTHFSLILALFTGTAEPMCCGQYVYCFRVTFQ
ncbi:hypothetical protein ACQJBY_027478 [Aegilops geniculata]